MDRKDFSYDITSGVDFLANVREKLIKYWYNVDQDTLLAILKVSSQLLVKVMLTLLTIIQITLLN